MTHMVEARGLVKRYGDVVALDGLDLTVPEGTILGLLGPSGAGKTTAVSILTTLLKRQSLESGRAVAEAVHALPLPPGYVPMAALYGLGYALVVLAITCFAFERKEFLR